MMMCELKSQKTKIASQLIKLVPDFHYHDISMLLTLTLKELQYYEKLFTKIINI